jgi:hypothetical protein
MKFPETSCELRFKGAGSLLLSISTSTGNAVLRRVRHRATLGDPCGNCRYNAESVEGVPSVLGK